jgi:hypothetical protein
MSAAEDQDDDVEDAIHVDGVSEATQKMRAYVKKIQGNLEVDGNLAIVVSQQWRDGRKVAIGQVDFSHDRSLEEIVQEIVDGAVEDCMELRAKSMKYHVAAEGMKGHAQFTLKCPQYDDEDDGDLEDPSKKGLLMMTMRHQETTFKLAIQDRSDVMTVLKDENRELRERCRLLEERSIENMKAYEDLISGKHARDLEMKRLDNSEQRKDMALSTVLQGMPILIGKLVGGPEAAAKMATQIPGGRTQLELLVEGFLKTLDGPQFGKIVESGLFSPVQVAGLVEIAKFCMERDEIEKKSLSGKSDQQASSGTEESKTENKEELS